MAKNGNIESKPAMINPAVLLDKLNLSTDLRFYIKEECGRGGFDFYIVKDGRAGMVCQVNGRDCFVRIDGSFKVYGTLKVVKDFYCGIIVSVYPTGEDTNDGYSCHCYYEESPKEYIYSEDVNKLVTALRNEMNSHWRYQDKVWCNAYPCRKDGRAYDGVAQLETYLNLGEYDSHYLYF